MESEYKYNLNKLIHLRAISDGTSVKALEEMVQEKYGIPVSTFRKHRAIRKDTDSTFAEHHMTFYAEFFNTTPDQIRNYKLEAVNG